MQKFAHLVKTAEIRGVMAYLVDSEMVKVASEGDFDSLVNEVSEAIGDEQYDLNTVLSKTAEIIEGSQEQDSKQEKTAADVVGAGIGAIRAADLSHEERKLLKEKHGLGSESSLTARNAGRGYLGGIGGGIVGGGAGAAFGAATRNPGVLAGSTLLGTIGGGLYGAKRATDKYSRSSPHLRGKE